jgi:hypothetical protein
MKVLTDGQAREWCENERIHVTKERYLAYKTSERLSFGVPLADKPSRIIALANYLVPAWDAVSFKGAFLWIRARGIGDDDSERTGLMIFDQMRGGAGEKRSLAEAPATLFDPDELAAVFSYFVIPLLFGWDAFLIPKGQDYFVFVSHDDVACVVAKSKEAYDMVYRRVGSWKPQESGEWYFRGISV